MKVEKSLKVDLCEWLMKLFRNDPDPDTYNYFRGTSNKLVRSIAAYNHEKDVGFETYFKRDLRYYLSSNAITLDFGCGPGGRTVCWKRKFGTSHFVGIDNSLVHLRSALSFSKSQCERGLSYLLSRGEELPFSDETFDTILSFDVLEHVDDVKECMWECQRVLKTGGFLFLVFPPYYSPTGLHINQFTSVPWLNLLFDKKTIAMAHNGLVASYDGKFKKWLIKDPKYANGRLGSINCMEISEFEKIVKEQKWYVEEKTNLPLLKTGEFARKHKYLRLLSYIPAEILARAPYLAEYFTHRVVRILKKI